jgi:hypothetical protein
VEPTDPHDGMEPRLEATEPPSPARAVTSEIPPPPPLPFEAPWGVPTEPGGQGMGPPPPPKRSRARLLLVGAAIVVILGIVIGVVVASGGGGGTPLADLSPTGAPAPSASAMVAPPVGFTATGQSVPFGVVMTWSAPAGQAVQSYGIYREGVPIATVPSETTTYTDSNVKPGKSYTYEIVTRGDGLIQSARVSSVVDVPVPPLSSARFKGTFDAKMKTTSQDGYTNKLGSFTLGWNFKPKCSEGSCDVTWKDLYYKEFRTTLDHKGVNYSGSDSGTFFGTCSGAKGTSTLTLTLHVVKAKVIDGEWRATKLQGTMVESHASAFGCVSGGAHFTVTANYGG